MGVLHSFVYGMLTWRVFTETVTYGTYKQMLKPKYQCTIHMHVANTDKIESVC